MRQLFHYKMWQFYYEMRSYYKNTTILLQNTTLIAKYVSTTDRIKQTEIANYKSLLICSKSETALLQPSHEP